MSVKWNGPAFVARAQQAAMGGVTEWIGLVEDEAVRLIQDTAKHGRIYRRRGIEHQASAPGEPPASDTGNLVNNRRIDLIPARLAARLTFSAEYAAYLQFGTENVEPRPWADVALANTQEAGRAALITHMAPVFQ